MGTVVLGAVAGLAGVILGQLLARRGEDRKWLRDERHRAAAGLLAAGEALRRHSAARIVALYAGSIGDIAADEYLTDLERLGLAAEAVRTVYPPAIAALADRLHDAAQGLAYVGLAERPQAAEASPGDLYASARDKFTAAVRRLIVPSGPVRAVIADRRAGPAAG